MRGRKRKRRLPGQLSSPAARTSRSGELRSNGAVKSWGGMGRRKGEDSNTRRTSPKLAIFHNAGDKQNRRGEYLKKLGEQ